MLLTTQPLDFRSRISARNLRTSCWRSSVLPAHSSFTTALFFTVLARFANLSVDNVVPKQSDDGLTVAIKDVLELPPNESRRRNVSFESRYGTCHVFPRRYLQCFDYVTCCLCLCCRVSWKLELKNRYVPNALSDLLMLMASQQGYPRLSCSWDAHYPQDRSWNRDVVVPRPDSGTVSHVSGCKDTVRSRTLSIHSSLRNSSWADTTLDGRHGVRDWFLRYLVQVLYVHASFLLSKIQTLYYE